jgi:hypothetical protein
MRQGPHCTQTGVATYPPNQPLGQCAAASTVDVPAKRRRWPAKRCGPLSAASSSGSSMWRRAARRCVGVVAVLDLTTCKERARLASGFPPSCTGGSVRRPKKWGAVGCAPPQALRHFDTKDAVLSVRDPRNRECLTWPGNVWLHNARRNTV